MFCIKCLNPTTQVTNSRPHKKAAGVWRRRHCTKCGQTFTTDERPRIKDTQAVWSPTNGDSLAFNPGLLLISISEAFGHDPIHGKNIAWDLMETVTQILTLKFPDTLSTDDITTVTHQVLERYDRRAGLQYGLQHNLLSQKAIRRKRS